MVDLINRAEVVGMGDENSKSERPQRTQKGDHE